MKAVIIEDENLIARELQNKISLVAEDVEVIEILPSLKTAKKWFLNNSEPDILFVDIQLSDGISFELFESYNLTCPVIFTTAYDEYAIRAFKVNGVDYLLKPIDEDELKSAIEKCRKFISNQSKIPVDIAKLISNLQNQPNSQPLYKEKFIVSVRNNWIPVETKDIACFVRENLNYLYTFTGDKYILDFNSLDHIEELLDPKLFYRANRQCIIHMNSIQSIKLHNSQKLFVLLKEPLKMEIDISREKAPAFKKWLDR